MSQPSSHDTQSSGGGGGEPAKRVNDDENKSQNATINRIQRYRDDIADYQLLFAKNELDEQVSATQQHRAYHQLVKGFLQLLKPYLSDPEIPRADHYWNTVELGSFSVEPPPVIRQPSKEQMEQAVRAGHQQTISRADPRNSVNSKSYSVIGLRDFAAAQPEWTVSWRVLHGPEVAPRDLRSEITDASVRVEKRGSRTDPITVTKAVRVPRDIIDNAATELENFVRDVGMDVELDEATGDAEFDYSDILEEGPPENENSGLLDQDAATPDEDAVEGDDD